MIFFPNKNVSLVYDFFFVQVLIKEEDIVDDEERLRPVKGQLPGELTLYKHLGMYFSSLSVDYL